MLKRTPYGAPGLRSRLGRAWLLFICFPSTLRPLAYYSVMAGLLATLAALSWLYLHPPAALQNRAGADTGAETSREREARRREEDRYQQATRDHDDDLKREERREEDRRDPPTDTPKDKEQKTPAKSQKGGGKS